MRRKSGKWGNDKSKSGFGACRDPRVIWLGKDTSFGAAIYYLLTVSKKFKLSVVHAQDGTLRNEQRNLVGWQGFERGTGKCKTFCRSGSLAVDRANRIRCLTGTSHRRAGLEAVEGNIMSGFQGGARTAAETEASRLGRPGQSHLALLCSSVAAYL